MVLTCYSKRGEFARIFTILDLGVAIPPAASRRRVPLAALKIACVGAVRQPTDGPAAGNHKGCSYARGITFSWSLDARRLTGISDRYLFKAYDATPRPR